MDFSQRQQEYEEEHYSSLLKINSVYAILKGGLCTLCKLIDGYQDQINEWKKTLLEGIGIATSDIQVGKNDSSSSTSLIEYISCYKGNGNIMKRKHGQASSRAAPSTF
eukprot:1225464-Ditylum_brightwellii.AAC.1